MNKDSPEFEYGKWDSPEEIDEVFKYLNEGTWGNQRFKKWVKKVESEIYRDATADESM